MIENKKGHIINISSIFGIKGSKGQNPLYYNCFNYFNIFIYMYVCGIHI